MIQNRWCCESVCNYAECHNDECCNDESHSALLFWFKILLLEFKKTYKENFECIYSQFIGRYRIKWLTAFKPSLLMKRYLQRTQQTLQVN